MTIHGDDKDMIIVTWSFTNTCNFACSYCPEYLHDNSVGFPDIDDALYFVDQLSKNAPMVYFELLGGETTLWPKLIEFLTRIKQYNNVVVEINTNGSRSNGWWERFVDADLSSNTLLIFSYHAAQCDPDVYYKNLEIASVDHHIASNFMLDPEYFHTTKKLFDRVIDTLPVDCLFKVLRHDFKPSELVDGYTAEMLDIIKNTNSNRYNRDAFPRKKGENTPWPCNIYEDGKILNWQETIIDKKHKFKNWSCSAGSKRFVIGMRGDVHPCHETSGRRGTVSEYTLGNINRRDVKILDDYMKCPADYCACKMDALTEKFE